MIPFNKPTILGGELKLISECFDLVKFSGDGSFTKLCHNLLDSMYPESKALLTTSCTDALELSALLSKISPGDEVIMPSYTFVSTANAFALRGAKVVFVDIDPKSMNMDSEAVANAMSRKTKAIVAVHYAGWSSDMDKLSKLSLESNSILIEDAAQAIGSEYKGKKLGTLGRFSCFSFHETKNIHCGEGGAILLNQKEDLLLAEIHREKGTNRSQFLRGQQDKYTWIELGSSYLPSELNAAYLSVQLQNVEKINAKRLELWNTYNTIFKALSINGLELLECPAFCKHNAHLFAIKLDDIEVRTRLTEFLKSKGIMAVFHYVPLHSSPGGKKFSEFRGTDRYTTRESERLLRLPLFYDLTISQVEYIADLVNNFFKTKN